MEAWGLNLNFLVTPKSEFALSVMSGGPNIIFRLREASKIKLWATYLRGEHTRYVLFSI